MLTMEDYRKMQEKSEDKNTISSIRERRRKKKRKKQAIIAGATALAVAIGGGATAAYLINQNENDYDSQLENDVVNDDYKYVLAADFKANDAEEVNEVAQAIKENTGAQINIKNLIKFYNRTLEKDDFNGVSDEEIFNALLNFGVDLYNDVYVTDALENYASITGILQSTNPSNVEIENKINNIASDKLVTPSAILGNTNSDENEMEILKLQAKIDEEEQKIARYNKEITDKPEKTEKYNKKISKCELKITEYKEEIEGLKTKEQKYNDKIAMNLESSLKSIREKDTNQLSKLSQDFYDIYEEIKNDEDLSVEKPERWKVYMDYFQAVCSIYGNYLTKDQIDVLKGEHQGFSNENYVKELAREWGIDVASIIAKAAEDGTYGKEITEFGSKYVESDANKANNSSFSKGDDTKTIEKHGEKVNGSSGSKETIKDSVNLGTTTEKEETLPDPKPEDKPKDEVVEEGGKPVGDPVIDGDDEKPGEIIGEEDVVPGKEEDSSDIIGETEDVYVDADGEEFEGVYTEDEFSAAKQKIMNRY